MSINNKLMIILALGLILILIFINVILSSVKNSGKNKETINQPSALIPSKGQSPSQGVKKKEPRRTISGVSVYDFYKTQIQKNIPGYVYIKEDPNYTIFYDPKSEEFSILIQDPAFYPTLSEAEKVLVKELDVSTQDACKLKIGASTTFSVNRELAGKRFPLSSCQK